jgi:hypothetical protein
MTIKIRMNWIKTDGKKQRTQLIGDRLMAQPSSKNSLDNTGWTTKIRQPGGLKQENSKDDDEIYIPPGEASYIE